jgi:hypothetical protein
MPKERRSQKAIAIEKLVDSLNDQIRRHQIAIEELTLVKDQLIAELAVSRTSTKREPLKVAG